jgi:hypothetical protein
MGVGHVLLRIVEVPLPASRFFSSDVVAFSWEDDTTNLLTLTRALQYTAYTVARLNTSPRHTICDGCSPKLLEEKASDVRRATSASLGALLEKP